MNDDEKAASANRRPHLQTFLGLDRANNKGARMNELRLPAGIYDDVPAAAYHADCAEEPSLSASFAQLLLDRTPRHAFVVHPRLNPHFDSTILADGKFDLGSVAHEIILGRGGGYAIVQADNWMSKAAKEQRDEARAEGKTPILARQFDDASEMAVMVVLRLLEIPETHCLIGEAAFPGLTRLTEGTPERVLVWHDAGGPLCRAMIDWHGPDLNQVWDLKTVGVPLEEWAVSSHFIRLGYDMKAAFYLRGLSALFPELAGTFKFRWICVESTPPFEVRVFEPSAHMLALGDRKAALAIAKWDRCIKSGEWPGYPPEVSRLSYLGAAEERWIEREMTDPDALAMAARPLLTETQIINSALTLTGEGRPYPDCLRVEWGAKC